MSLSLAACRWQHGRTHAGRPLQHLLMWMAKTVALASRDDLVLRPDVFW